MTLPTISPTPRSLIERLREPSDAQAWSLFVDLYTPLILIWLRRLGVRDSDLAELAQEVFAALVRELRVFRYDPAGRFRGFLFSITRSKAIDHLRRQAGPSAVTVPLPDDLPARGNEIEALVEADYRRRLVSRAIEVMRSEFEDKTWRACWETIVEGREIAEVAASLGMTVPSVYQAKTRVLRRLRLELDGLLD